LATERPEFDSFVAQRSPRLLRVAFLLTRDWAGAEDLLQTALAKAWFAWSRIDGDPEAYIRRIIATTFTSWRRRRWQGEIPQDPPDREWTADSSQRHADRDVLWRALGRLSARQRAVVVLRYFEDLTESQTAETLGVSVGTVKTRTSRALARLRSDPALDRVTFDREEVAR
jgi:RNA polymerase sigma-70 factor (sigma-E family)